MDIESFLETWRDDKEYIEAKTSGSTGRPKTIRLLKSDMVSSARSTNEFFNIDDSSTLLLPLSIDYIAGKMMAVRAECAKCRLIVVAPSNAFELPQDVGRIDLLSVVPSQVDWLIKNPAWSRVVVNVIVGGAPLENSKGKALVDAGYNAFCTYGMTETCSHVALLNIKSGRSVYRAMPGISFSVDSRSCLVILAPSFSFQRLVTNDIVTLVDDKSFVWRGRYDNVINTGGIKIFPEEVEKEIAPYIHQPFYVRGVKDEKWGESLELVVEGEVDRTSLMEILRSSCVNHARLPKRIKCVDRIDRTTNGKIKREK